MNIKIIDAVAETTGAGFNKVVLPNVGTDNNKIGAIKVAKKHQVGGHSVVFLITNSTKESINLKAYLETKVIRMLVKSVKAATPNSKSLFKHIPNIDLNILWTDEALYEHFDLTQEEIDFVEANVK